MAFEQFKADLALAVAASEVVGILQGFTAQLLRDSSITGTVTKPMLAQAAMAKRNKDASLWTTDVAKAFRSLLEAYQTAVSAPRVENAKAPVLPPAGPGAVEPPILPASGGGLDVSSCHPKLRLYLNAFTKSEEAAAAAAEGAMTALTSTPEALDWVLQGNGIACSMALFRRAVASSNELLQRNAVRYIAQAALKDANEKAFFAAGALGEAMRMLPRAASLSVKVHAARLFFNLSYMKENRPSFLAQGAMQHLLRLVNINDSDTTSIQKITLSAAKTLVQLVCHPDCVQKVMAAPELDQVWSKLAVNTDVQVRERAAKVFVQISRIPSSMEVPHRHLLARMANSILHGPIATSADSPLCVQAVQEAKNFVRAVLDPTAHTAAVATGAPEVSAACDAKFAPYFRRFGVGLTSDAQKAVMDCLGHLQRDRSWRPLTVKGNGVEMIMYAAKHAQRSGSAEYIRAAVRLVAEAALHDDTEPCFFEAGALELAMQVFRAAQNESVAQHAARLVFNLSYCRQNREAVVRKGGVDHMAHVLLDMDRSIGTYAAIKLSTAKMSVQLACLPASLRLYVQHPRFKEIWLAMATSDDPQVRRRAAVTCSKVLNTFTSPEQRATYKYMATEVTSGKLSADTYEQARDVQAAVLVLEAPSGVADVDVSDCDPLFKDYYLMFHSTDARVLYGALNAALGAVQVDKERRPRAAQGSGVKHILGALRRAPKNTHDQKAALRLAAESALHDDTESKFFEEGALELAMHIARTVTDNDILTHATRFFFNLTYCRLNRPSVMDKGGMEFIREMVQKAATLSAAQGGQVILQMAKAMVQLACLQACKKRLASHPHFVQLVITFCQSTDSQVRLRAAKIFNNVATEKSDESGNPTFARAAAFKPLLATIITSLENDTGSHFERARKLAMESISA